MKTFQCDGCGSLLFFENVKCLKCRGALGFLPDTLSLLTLQRGPDDLWQAAQSPVAGQLFRSCLNGQQHAVCNWLIPAEDNDPFCASCRLNKVIPDLTLPPNRERWHRLELAKRRLLYTLLRLGLPLKSSTEGIPSLAFQFLAEVPGGLPVLTGYHEGLITINLIEADDPEREARRVSLHEPYRTLLGHLRHESGHYYWDRLIKASPWQEKFRQLFGDETVDYAAALRDYYSRGPSADWNDHFPTAYASAHPWEDWTETWHHYLQIVDTLETAAAFGLTLKPDHPAAEVMMADPRVASDGNASFDMLLNNWLPLTYALNSFNRGGGLTDLYPFVLSHKAIEKLRFVHEVVAQTGARQQKESCRPDPVSFP